MGSASVRHLRWSMTPSPSTRSTVRCASSPGLARTAVTCSRSPVPGRWSGPGRWYSGALKYASTCGRHLGPDRVRVVSSATVPEGDPDRQVGDRLAPVQEPPGLEGGPDDDARCAVELHPRGRDRTGGVSARGRGGVRDRRGGLMAGSAGGRGGLRLRYGGGGFVRGRPGARLGFRDARGGGGLRRPGGFRSRVRARVRGWRSAGFRTDGRRRAGRAGAAVGARAHRGRTGISTRRRAGLRTDGRRRASGAGAAVGACAHRGRARGAGGGGGAGAAGGRGTASVRDRGSGRRPRRRPSWRGSA